MLVIVDGDPIVYRAGFAGEDIEYHVVYEDDQHGPEYFVFQRDDKETATKKLRRWEETVNPEDIIECDKQIVPEELDHVLSTVRAILRDTRYSVAEHFGIDADQVHLRVLLSGPGNFRDDIATIAPYKGNRKESYKPYWYQQIRNYLTDTWDAEVVEGREADDECSIQQYQNENTVIASIDKDLDQVPGWHYDYVRKTFYFTEEVEGQLLFYKQVLSGDSTDNIPGCYKIGTKRAASIIDTVYAEYGIDHQRIWQTILDTYADSLEKYGEACPYYDKANDEGIEAVAIETARLVKMQEYVGQLWNPPGIDDDELDLGFDE